MTAILERLRLQEEQARKQAAWVHELVDKPGLSEPTDLTGLDDRDPIDIDMLDMEALKARPDELEPAKMRKHKAITDVNKSSSSKSLGRVSGLVEELLHSTQRQNPPKSSLSEGWIKPKPLDTSKSTRTSRSPSPETARKRMRTARAGDPRSSPSTSNLGPRPAGYSASEAPPPLKPSRKSILHSSRDAAFTTTHHNAPTIKPLETEIAASGVSDASSVYDPTTFKGYKVTHVVDPPVGRLEEALIWGGAEYIPFSPHLRDDQVDFVVCRLESSRKFAHLPKHLRDKLVTECFIERCLVKFQVLDPDSLVIYKPLDMDIPIPRKFLLDRFALVDVC